MYIVDYSRRIAELTPYFSDLLIILIKWLSVLPVVECRHTHNLLLFVHNG